MGFFSADIETVDDLFMHTLNATYYAENKIINALPTMIEKADNDMLKQAFKMHLEETMRQVKMLPGSDAAGSPAIDGIIQEADDVTSDIDNPFVMDAALIVAAQAVEHYEINRYGSLIAWAEELKLDPRIVSLLTQTLGEEKAADVKLTQLATQAINRKAA
jgi:ferritin-like metal-binding protein YciE